MATDCHYHGGEVNMLRLIAEDTCDGVDPETHEVCVLGEHKGYHRTADGTEWLSED
jgi:hypothetical protein